MTAEDRPGLAVQVDVEMLDNILRHGFASHSGEVLHNRQLWSLIQRSHLIQDQTPGLRLPLHQQFVQIVGQQTGNIIGQSGDGHEDTLLVDLETWFLMPKAAAVCRQRMLFLVQESPLVWAPDSDPEMILATFGDGDKPSLKELFYFP